MALPLRPVYIDYLMADGTPNRGYVEFTMTSDVVVNGMGIIQAQTIRKYLDVNGRVATELLVTDNSAIIPDTWVWSIEEKIENGNVWYAEVPTGDMSPLNLAGNFSPSPPPSVGGTIDHGSLTGLGDDDHSQYLTKSRGDQYYAPIGSGAGGTARVVQIINSNTVAGSALNTDYVYKCMASLKLTLPTSVGNKNMYTVKNFSTGTITIDIIVPETIDGAATFVFNTQYMSISLVSDGNGQAASWMVV